MGSGISCYVSGLDWKLVLGGIKDNYDEPQIDSYLQRAIFNTCRGWPYCSPILFPGIGA